MTFINVKCIVLYLLLGNKTTEKKIKKQLLNNKTENFLRFLALIEL